MARVVGLKQALSHTASVPSWLFIWLSVRKMGTLSCRCSHLHTAFFIAFTQLHAKKKTNPLVFLVDGQ